MQSNRVNSAEPLLEASPKPAPLAFERRAGNAAAFLTSLVLHVGVMLLLACLAYQVGKPSHGLLLNAEQGTSDKTSLDMLQAFEIQPATDPGRDEEVELSPDVSLSVDLDNVFQQPGSNSGLAASLTSVSVGDVVESLKTGGRGRGASFFGTYAEGNRFVYVLDSSRSMRGDRWVYACNQLVDSLNALKPGQEFFVICFDMETSFLFNTPPSRAKFFEADKDTVTRVRRWLRGRTLGRATMPAEALRAGLKFNPDAIFLLSDGELQDNSIAILRRVNGFSASPRQIPIHTVHLFSPEGRTSLELIAMENNGTFTHVDGH